MVSYTVNKIQKLAESNTVLASISHDTKEEAEACAHFCSKAFPYSNISYEISENYHD